MIDLPQDQIADIERIAQNILVSFVYSNKSLSVTKPDILVKHSFDWAEAFVKESRRRYRPANDKSA